FSCISPQHPMPLPLPYTTLFRSDQQIFESGKIPVKSLSQITNTRHRYGIPAGEKARGRHHAIPTLTRVVSETPERIVYAPEETEDRKSTRLNSSHVKTSYAVFCL